MPQVNRSEYGDSYRAAPRYSREGTCCILVSRRGTISGLAVEIQNHSPVDFFFSGITFPLSDGNIFIVRDDVVSGPIYPRKIAAGDGMSLFFDVRSWGVS